MATTEVFYNGDNSDVTFTIPFEYLEESDVKVSVGGTLKTQDTDYTFSTLTEITFTTAPPTGVNNVRIFRDTDIDSGVRNEFFAGSAIRAQDLNDDFLQVLYSAQEIEDQFVTKSDGEFDTNVDMNSNRITDMADPVNAQDAVTKQYLEDNYFDDGTETIVAAETWPDNDTTIATTAAIDNRVDSKIDTAIEGDILINNTGLSKSATGGQVTLGIAANSVDLDRIKDSDKITLSEQESDNDQVGTDDQIFTAKAATRRFNNYYQNDAPTDTDGVGIGQVWVDPNDDLTLSVWTGSAWSAITSGGTFTNQPKVVYVDAGSGDDSNDGHRISRPKKTIAAALSDINGDASGDGSIISVAPGIYAETLPLDIEKNDIGIIGQSLRTCIIHPKIPTADQASYDVDTPHSQELQTMFRVNSGSYFANLTLTGLKASGSRGTGASLYTNTTYGLPPNQGWNFAFYPSATIKKSPYIQNVTNFSDSQINNVTFTPHTPGEGAAGDLDSAPTGGGILVDGSVPATASPLRSMVCDSYTHTALDGPGIFVTNNGYCQATSSYAFFNHGHITAVNGGQANLAASTTDFGRYGLIADGKSTSAIFTSNVDGAANSGAISFNINEPTAGSNWFGDTQRPATNMLVEVNSVIYPILSATANTDSEGGNGWTVTISRPDSSNRSTNLGLNGAISDNAAVSFYLRSMIASSSHTMEYVGSGTDYRALPENGGVPVEANQKVELNNGKIWTATTDHNGKFTIGGNQTDDPFFEVDQQLGFVTIPEGSIAFNLLSDETPQLGGDLDVNGKKIVSDSGNENIVLNPHGTGAVNVSSSKIINVTDPTSAQDAATKNYVDTQIGGIDEVVEDTTPQLGGNLDLNSNNIDGTGNIDITGSVTTSANSEVNGVSIGRGAGDVATNTVVGNNALDANTTGANNTAIGDEALTANTTGFQNVAVGANALAANTTGASNVAVGNFALDANTTAHNNTAVGYDALGANTTGHSNCAIGTDALDSNTTGSQNTAVGRNALEGNTTANNNTAVGFGALKVTTTGVSNTGIGLQALNANTTGQHNVAVGKDAGVNTTTGQKNVVVGSEALYTNTTGQHNVSVGYNSLFTNNGNNNVGIGYSSMFANTSGTRNVAVGALALDANTTGNDNIAIGNEALDANTTGIRNVAIGTSALGAQATGSENVAVGFYALVNNSTSGQRNVAVGNEALSQNTTGDNNVGIGHACLDANTTGNQNVAVGRSALGANTTGGGNTAVGDNALHVNTTANNNTGIGIGALGANTTGAQNTAVGGYALNANTTANNNSALGYSALLANTTGHSNVAVGVQALDANTTGTTNTVIGFDAQTVSTTSVSNTCIGNVAGQVLTTGSYNVFVGSGAGDAQTTANSNVAIGNGALTTNTTSEGCVAVGGEALQMSTGANNTAVGFQALEENTTGSNNAGFGAFALDASTTGSKNTGIGTGALGSNTSASNNTAVGYDALFANTTGAENVAVGARALDASTTGAYNTAIGTSALGSNTTASQNTACGRDALFSNTTGNQNTAVGYNTLDANTTGVENVAVGAQAMGSNTTGHFNTAVGRDALFSNTSGDRNVAVGQNTLDANTSGAYNTAVGQGALTKCTTGQQNTATGSDALEDVTTGNYNNGFGRLAGYQITTGQHNVCLGQRAGYNITTGNRNVCIGHECIPAGSNGEQQVVIGYAISGKGTRTFFVSSDSGVYHGGNTTTWSTTSDRRIKKNIVDNSEGLSLINQIAVKNFEYKTAEEIESAGEVPVTDTVDKTGTQIGVIAQELQQVRSSWVTTRENGTLSVTGSDEIIWHLVNSVKELSAKNTALEARIAALESA